MKRHTYTADPQSGAGNCTCGAPEAHRRHPHVLRPSRDGFSRCICGLPFNATQHTQYFVEPVPAPTLEVRPYTGTPGSSAMGRTTSILDCPFCGARVVAYVWCLAGGGKRCECGALFGSTGTASKLVEP